MECSIKFEMIKSGWPIVCIEGSQVIFYFQKILYFFFWSLIFSQQTVYTLMKCCIMLHFIWVFNVCLSTHIGVSSLQRVWKKNYGVPIPDLCFAFCVTCEAWPTHRVKGTWLRCQHCQWRHTFGHRSITFERMHYRRVKHHELQVKYKFGDYLQNFDWVMALFDLFLSKFLFSDQWLLKGFINFIPTLQRYKASLSTGQVQIWRSSAKFWLSYGPFFGLRFWLNAKAILAFLCNELHISPKLLYLTTSQYRPWLPSARR